MLSPDVFKVTSVYVFSQNKNPSMKAFCAHGWMVILTNRNLVFEIRSSVFRYSPLLLYSGFLNAGLLINSGSESVFKKAIMSDLSLEVKRPFTRLCTAGSA